MHLPSGRFATARCGMQTTLFSGDRRGHGTAAASFWRRPRDPQGSRPVPLASAGRLLCSRRQAIDGERRDWKPRASGVFFGSRNITTTSGSCQRGSPSPARSDATMVPLFAKSQPPPNAMSATTKRPYSSRRSTVSVQMAGSPPPAAGSIVCLRSTGTCRSPRRPPGAAAADTALPTVKAVGPSKRLENRSPSVNGGFSVGAAARAAARAASARCRRPVSSADSSGARIRRCASVGAPLGRAAASAA